MNKKKAEKTLIRVIISIHAIAACGALYFYVIEPVLKNGVSGNGLLIFLTLYALVGLLISIRLNKQLIESFSVSRFEKTIIFIATVLLYPCLILPENEDDESYEDWVDRQW